MSEQVNDLLYRPAPTTRRTLFKIEADLLALDALLDECEGEINDPKADAAIQAWFAELQSDICRKLDGYVELVKIWEMEAALAREEAELFAKQAKSRENRVKWFKGRLLNFLQATRQVEVETLKGRTVCVQKNGGKVPIVWTGTVHTDDVEERFIRVTKSIDQDAVRAALEAGEKLAFADLGEVGQHVRIRY